jgi:hypothetical protein
MKQKPVKTAYRHEFRRQRNDQGVDLPPPAETSQEGGKLVMTIAGVRYIGKRTGGAFVWVAEDGSG